MRKILISLCSALLVLLICACNFDSGKPDMSQAAVEYPESIGFEDYSARKDVRNSNPLDESVAESIKQFSYKTATELLMDTKENLNYSPLSLYYALALATSGASGETQEEMLNVLGISDVDMLNEQCGNMYRLLYTDNEIGRLKIANSIWMDDEMNGESVIFKDSFVQTAVEKYYASSHQVDFSDESAGKAMAKWVSENTGGTLSPEFPLDPEKILCIINTVYFYDQWIDRFDADKTAESEFHLSNGSTVNCDFMNQTFFAAGFTKGENFTRASLSLKNQSSMVFILPDEGVSPRELLSSPEKMQVVFEGEEGGYGEVVWKLPKFSFASRMDLIDTLLCLGIESAFKQDADFSGITDHQAFISAIRQETHIAIDEQGVEASDFTEIGYAGSGQSEGRADMILDRPFIYGIRAFGGALLFVGICENPGE